MDRMNHDLRGRESLVTIKQKLSGKKTQLGLYALLVAAF